MKDFDIIKKELQSKILKIKTKKELQNLRIKYLGKKGEVTQLGLMIKDMQDKKTFGAKVNKLKIEIQNEINQLELTLDEKERENELLKQKIDVSLPSQQLQIAKQNILIKTAREIEDIFINLGFEVAIGQEVESDYHNFEALNLAKDHPARDMQDSFYLNPHILLRTHTSNIQSRVLKTNPNQELKIICPGKVYRRDDDDATHSHQFMQIEGLVIAKKETNHSASLKDLKTLLTMFVNQIFDNNQIKLRMRPSFFPFTEPSVEVDISCSNCQAKGCSFCKQTGWIEVLGAGIVHQEVLKKAGFDSEKYLGYAFGIGVERIALLKYQIDDIRRFYINDLRFIKQF